MPSSSTFSIKPIRDLVCRHLEGRTCIVDPMCGTSSLAHHRNDLAHGGDDARVFLQDLCRRGVVADAVIYDPPYSPTQLARSYKDAGRSVGQSETQDARLNSQVKDRLDFLLMPGGVAICCGWNSSGMGLNRGYSLQEVLLVCHGGAHNDTIVTVEVKNPL